MENHKLNFHTDQVSHGLEPGGQCFLSVVCLNPCTYDLNRDIVVLYPSIGTASIRYRLYIVGENESKKKRIPSALISDSRTPSRPQP